MSKNSQISELINYLSYDSSGNIILSSLVGTGTRMVVSSSTGLLSTQAIPTLSDLSGVPTSRTLTINGVTYDLTANRSWSALPTGGVAGDILAKVDGTDYNATWIPNYTSQVQHLVKLGATMTAGTAVYVSSSTGNSGTNMIVSKASNATEGTSSKTLGLIKTGGNTNDIVFVITEGLLAGLDTSTASAGDPVWLGTNGGLIFGLLNKPVAPAHLVFIGVVTRAQQINGEIFVKVQNGFELGELHDYVQNGVQDNYVISYESSSSLYKPKSIATLLGYTPQAALSGTGFVKISGSTISYDNSTYLTTSSASSTYQTILTNPVTGTGTTNYLLKFTGGSTIGNSLIYDTANAILIGATTVSDNQSKLELVGSGPIGLKIKSSGGNGNNTFLSIESSKEWRFVTNRGDLISGNQGDLIIRNNTDGINHIILNQSGTTTFYSDIISNGTGTFSGGGNTLVLKKGTGSPAIALAGTSDQATGLIEGVSGGGIKFYTSTGTLSSPSWSSKLLITPTEGVKFGANAVSIIGTEGADGYHYMYAGGTPKIYLEAAGVVAFLNTGGTFVGTTTKWNGEKFGVQTSNSTGWSTIPSIMRLTNYISGGVTKITFTDSNIIDGWFGMVPVANASYFAMGFSGYVEQGFKLYQNGSASINAASIGYDNTKLQVNGTSTTDENAGTVFIQHSFSGTNGFGLVVSRNGISAAALSLGADSSNNGIISANNTNLRLGKNTSGTFYEYLNINTNGNSVFSGNVLPVSDAVYTLGSPSFRWNHVYTTDLHLSNEGKQNIVDGTWGDWTLQEGENDIFMLNNRSGEKFKMKLEKV